MLLFSLILKLFIFPIWFIFRILKEPFYFVFAVLKRLFRFLFRIIKTPLKFFLKILKFIISKHHDKLVYLIRLKLFLLLSLINFFLACLLLDIFDIAHFVHFGFSESFVQSLEYVGLGFISASLIIFLFIWYALSICLFFYKSNKIWCNILGRSIVTVIGSKIYIICSNFAKGLSILLATASMQVEKLLTESEKFRIVEEYLSKHNISGSYWDFEHMLVGVNTKSELIMKLDYIREQLFYYSWPCLKQLIFRGIDNLSLFLFNHPSIMVILGIAFLIAIFPYYLQLLDWLARREKRLALIHEAAYLKQELLVQYTGTVFELFCQGRIRNYRVARGAVIDRWELHGDISWYEQLQKILQYQHIFDLNIFFFLQVAEFNRRVPHTFLEPGIQLYGQLIRRFSEVLGQLGEEDREIIKKASKKTIESFPEIMPL